MKKIIAIALCLLLLTGCGSSTVTEVTEAPTEATVEATTPAVQAPVSRFQTVTEIQLSDDGITVDGGEETDTVYTSRDIIYYEDRDAYDSGNPYGEGTDADKHTAEEAGAHLVVNITAPGAYRVSGTLSAGQIRVDLGDDAYEDPDAVCELILCGADITSTVAPAILFLNTYECDGSWSVDAAQPEVDTTLAGANLFLEGENTVNGSYVARIYKDKEGEKKLWKQDGAIYSYMSMNVAGTGSLALTAANEGLDTELHLTINSGDIQIFADNDGINTNEDGVSVTTINGGNLVIFAGLGAEGDGIDSNGYLVINGGTVLASANPAADAGLDSDLGSYINGGSVTAFGSTMDWAESESGQVTMNLQFARQQNAGAEITILKEDGSELCSVALEGDYARGFTGLILSRPAFAQGETYQVYVDGVQMAYTGTDTMGGGMRPGGMGGQRPDGFEAGDFDPDELPEGFDPSQAGGMGQRPEGEMPEGMELPEGMEAPEGMERPQRGEGDRMTLPEGEMPTMPEGMESPEGMERPEMPEGGMQEQPGNGFGGFGQSGEASTAFYMNDMVNFFSGVTAAS